MTDRELLEKAAKAAGHGKVEWIVGVLGFERPHVRFDNSWSWTPWNPLTDDGDEARLEAALMLQVRWQTLRVEVYNENGCCIEYYRDHRDDKQAARRKAGVRAAAAIREQA